MLINYPPRILLYGRHSTGKQTASSSADQAASCMKLVNYIGGTVIATYLGSEQSEYRRDRPGLKKLVKDAENGAVDIVVCESFDRLARDAGDVAWLGKKLTYHRVALHTVSEGHVDEIKFAVAGLLGAIFLKHLIDKTIRGMETGRVFRLTPPPVATVLPHPALLRFFQQKVGALRDALDQESVRNEAAEILSTLIESVTTYPDGENGPEVEVVAKRRICWPSPQTTTPPRRAALLVLQRWLRGTRDGRKHTLAMARA